MSYDYSPDSIDVSSVQPNPSVDQSEQGTDGGAAAFSQIADAVGRWGTVIGSIVSNTPIAAAQTRTGDVVPIGAYGSSVPYVSPGPMPGTMKLLIALVLVGGIWYFMKG